MNHGKAYSCNQQLTCDMGCRMRHTLGVTGKKCIEYCDRKGDAGCVFASHWPLACMHALHANPAWSGVAVDDSATTTLCAARRCARNAAVPAQLCLSPRYSSGRRAWGQFLSPLSRLLSRLLTGPGYCPPCAQPCAQPCAGAQPLLARITSAAVATGVATFQRSVCKAARTQSRRRARWR